ncbi:hypothetical protein ACWD6R_11570 [Streptomyces sp. NPDC005151]
MAQPANPNDSVWHFRTKDEADGVKHKLNGMSTSVDVLKVAAGFAAFGFTPFKIDASFFKMDEKGIVIAGVQKWTWPHARDEKAKLEAADKKLVKLEKGAGGSYGSKARHSAGGAAAKSGRLPSGSQGAGEAGRQGGTGRHGGLR